MKTLVESLFDRDLIKRDPLGYIYDFVRYAKIYSDFVVDEIDTHKVKQDFNKLSREFKPKDWNDNPYMSMAKIKRDPFEEILRELLYIVVTNVKTSDVIKSNLQWDIDDLYDHIKKIVINYIRTHTPETLFRVDIYKTLHNDSVNVIINFFDGNIIGSYIQFELPIDITK